jgi:hypothetical protein
MDSWVDKFNEIVKQLKRQGKSLAVQSIPGITLFCSIIFLYVLMASIVMAKTEYDTSQDRYTDSMIIALRGTVSELKSANVLLGISNVKLERENATQETELRILMTFAGFLLTGLIVIGWQIIKTSKLVKKAVVGFILLFAIGSFSMGCASARSPILSDTLNEPIVVCQDCKVYTCFAHWQCHEVGCFYCELRREDPFPFTCR